MGNAEELYDERCRLAIEGSGIGIFDWNIETGECFFSERFLRILGYSVNEVKNEFEEWIKKIHSEDIDRVIKIMNEHLEGRTSIFLIEHRVLSKNGKYKWILASGSMVDKDLESNMSSRVVGTIIDIDNKKNIESEIVENNGIEVVLQNSEEHWKDVLELMECAVWEWDIQKDHFSYSIRWKELLGYEDGEMGNTLKQWENRIHPDDLLKFREELDKYLQGEIHVFQNRHRMQCKNGNYIWIFTRSKITHWSKHGKPLKLIGVELDLGGNGLFPESYKYGEFQETIIVNGIEIAWNTQRGICTFRGLPVAMMWVDTTLANLMSGIEAMVGPERFSLALQSEGRKSIESDWFIISLYPDFREGFAAITMNAAIAGWGDWQLLTYEHEKKTCVFRVYNNWEGLYQKSLGVNWGSAILAGKLAGICSKLFDTNCWATQTKFVANGDIYDEFIVKPSTREVEKEIENLLVTDQATRADMAIALQKLYINEKKLRIQNKEIRAIIENTPDAFVFFNAKAEIILLNAEARKLYPHIYVGMSIEQFYDGYESFDLQNNIIPIEKLPTNRTLRGETIKNEIVVIKRDDQSQIIEVNSTPVFDKNNNLVSMAVSYRDVTEIIKSEEEIKSHNEHLLNVEKEKNDALKEAIKLKDEFFYLITHEFKTPMTVIDVALQAIEYTCKEEMSEKMVKYLNTIKLNVNRQIRLVNNLLDIVRINSGYFRVDKIRFDIGLVLEVIINSVKLYAEQKNVKLKFNNKLSRMDIYSDEEKLERIMLNLLSNALKFTPNGKSITVTLSSKKYKNNNMISISVKDEGVGIPEEKQAIIFERFGQVDNSLSRQAEGTGLGLHLVKLLVSSIGGEISCKSIIDKGSTFTVLIPIIEELTDFESNTSNKNDNLFSNSDNRIFQSTKIEFSDIYF